MRGSRATGEACLELVKRQSVVSHSLYSWLLSGAADERIETIEVLVRGQQKLTDSKVNGNANDIDALAKQILEGIMGAILRDE